MPISLLDEEGVPWFFFKEVDILNDVFRQGSYVYPLLVADTKGVGSY